MNEHLNDYMSGSQTQSMQACYENRLAALEERVKQLEKLVHYPYMAGKEQVERIEKLESQMLDLQKHLGIELWKHYSPPTVAKQTAQPEENLYAPLRSDAGALLALAEFARRLAYFNPSLYSNPLDVFKDFQTEARAILEKYSK